ncbi:MAG: type II toxin-antitoxin system VapC family toxin [Terriglobales bacterium]
MAIVYLLDTNTASDAIKGNVAAVRERLLKTPMAEIGISVITEAELRFGVARVPAAVRLKVLVEEFVLRVEVLPWNSAAARHYAELRTILERSGKPMGNMDMLIAAQALAAEAVLVTHDRVFKRVKGLKIEDWNKA